MHEVQASTMLARATMAGSRRTHSTLPEITRPHFRLVAPSGGGSPAHLSPTRVGACDLRR